MDSKMSELNKELEIRLSGAKKDESLDDQLFGAAQNLSESVYKNFLWLNIASNICKYFKSL